MIELDKRNYRKHSDKNKKIINKSLKELGAGRSILLDSENEIIAGNGVYEQAEKLGIPIKIIETDGNELIAVKRKDLKTNDEKRKTLALIDNHSSDISTFDIKEIKTDFDEIKLQEWDINLNFNELTNKLQEANKENLNSINQYVDHVLINGNNYYGIPEIDINKIGILNENIVTYIKQDYIEGNKYIWIWNSDTPPDDFTNIIPCFYTNDERFEDLYHNTSKYVKLLKNKNCNTIIMPNFSMYHDDPKIIRLFNLYKSRYVANYFQQAGFNIIADLQLNSMDYEQQIEGIPDYMPCAITQIHTTKTVQVIEEKIKNINKFIEEKKLKKLFLYTDNKGILTYKDKFNIECVFILSFIERKNALKCIH